MITGSTRAVLNIGHRLTVSLPSLCRSISSTGAFNVRKSDVKNDPPNLALKNAFDFDPSTISIDTIKSEFVHLGGGSISLKKDNATGIAQLQLVNSQMKNAYSGKMMCDLNDAMIELEN